MRPPSEPLSRSQRCSVIDLVMCLGICSISGPQFLRGFGLRSFVEWNIPSRLEIPCHLTQPLTPCHADSASASHPEPAPFPFCGPGLCCAWHPLVLEVSVEPYAAMVLGSEPTVRRAVPVCLELTWDPATGHSPIVTGSVMAPSGVSVLSSPLSFWEQQVQVSSGAVSCTPTTGVSSARLALPILPSPLSRSQKSPALLILGAAPQFKAPSSVSVLSLVPNATPHPKAHSHLRIFLNCPA